MKRIGYLEEIKRLHEMGWAIHWLHPKSKRPIGNGWTKGPRKTWEELEKTYRPGMNVGVRTGEASHIGDYYLACIDVDIKDEAFRETADAALAKLTGEHDCAVVLSGSGKGSRHLYCVTEKPFKMVTILKEPGKGEICVYSNGRQMVLPPSTHPDTGKPYVWGCGVDALPLLSFEGVDVSPKREKKEGGRPLHKTNSSFEWAPVEGLDIDWIPDVSDEIHDLIKQGLWKGAKVEDRSAYLPLAAKGLLGVGLNRDEVLTILTDESTYLGAAALERGGSGGRPASAKWLWEYTLKKVIDERDPKKVFKRASEYEEDKELEVEKVAEQNQGIKEDRDWKQSLSRKGPKGEGGFASTLKNVESIVCNGVSPLLARRDIFAVRDVYGAVNPWGGIPDELIIDDEVAKMKFWLSQKWNMEVGKDVLYDALTVIACRNSFDPVKDWLKKLPPWDGKKRLDSWLSDHFEAEGCPEYLAQVFRKWVVAMVMRQYNPGAKFDWMPIFEGPQDVGKSSFGRVLVGDKYFLDWVGDLSDKDSALALQGIWAVEMGELATLRKQDIDIVKAYITRTIDKVRPPFGRKVLEIPRRCVFYGTTNRDTYLKDETGNRRFKPIVVGRLDFAAIERDRDQLFAEAVYLYDHFIETELTMELTGKAKVFELKIQAEKMVQDEGDIMAEIIEKFFKTDAVKNTKINPKKFSMRELFQVPCPLQKWQENGRNDQFASKALKKLGAEKWKSDGRSYWKFVDL